MAGGLWVSSSPAGESLSGPIGARVLRVLDGDTLKVSVHIWLGQDVETRVRLFGIDAPELRGACPNERELAVRARAYLVARLGLRPDSGGGRRARVNLYDISLGKYGGRVLARVLTENGEDLGDSLLAAGLARPLCGRQAARLVRRRRLSGSFGLIFWKWTADRTRRHAQARQGAIDGRSAAQTVMSSNPPRGCFPPSGAERGRSPSERARSLSLPAVTGREVSRLLSTTFGALATDAGAPPGDPTGGGTKGFVTCMREYYPENQHKSNKKTQFTSISFYYYLSLIL